MELGLTGKVALITGGSEGIGKAAALKLGFVTESEFDRVVDPGKMVKPYVATS